MSAPLLEARGLVKTFGTNRVLRGVDVVVRPGEAIAVQGARASGRTTLLLCAAGLLRPDAGTVAWFGEERRGPAPPPGVAYVAERVPAAPFLTVREVLEQASHPADVTRAPVRVVRDAVERLALGASVGQPVSRLPAAVCFRLALAHALLGRPRLLLLDAPAVLDVATRAAVAELLPTLVASGVAVLHAGDAALPGAPFARTLTLRDGRTISTDARGAHVAVRTVAATLPAPSWPR